MRRGLLPHLFLLLGIIVQLANVLIELVFSICFVGGRGRRGGGCLEVAYGACRSCPRPSCWLREGLVLPGLEKTALTRLVQSCL